MSSISRAQHARLASIDFYMHRAGGVSRKEHAERFGLEGAQATRDLALYSDFVSPGKVVYNKSEKRYLTTDKFKPLFQHSTAMPTDGPEMRQLHRVLNAMFGIPTYSLVGERE